MFYVLLFLSLLGTGYTQWIQIDSIKTDYGFILLKKGVEPVIESYTKLLHVINITDYQVTLNNLESNFELLGEGREIIGPELELARHNLNTLLPIENRKNRIKRGLINIAGKFNKIFWGNMDSEDADEIYSHLANLDQNGKQMTDEINKQIVINNNLIKNINKISEHVNSQQSDLNSYLINTTNLDN